MVNKAIQELSLREKIGQLFMCGFSDLMPNQAIITLIESYHIGGIIYFRRNYESPEQLEACSAQLQARSKIPLFISIDQEGGMVARVEKGMTLMPGNMALGATRDADGVNRAARITGEELRTLGINMNFAPCVDVNNNPLNPVIGVRSYGESPQLVAELGVAAVKGYQAAGVAATVKHFPGHGDTSADSHLELPSVPHSRERLHEVELVPFKAAIEAGVDALMTAHVVFPAYEAQSIPATLSSSILTGLLRDELHFEGVISTDCLEMNAISETVGVGEGAVRALEAGADLLLISHRLDRQIEGIEAIIQAVADGRITEARIDESVARLLALKEKRRIDSQEVLECGLTQGERNGPVAWSIARELSEQSITVVKDELGTLPLKSHLRTLVVWPEVRVGTEVDEVIEQEITLGAALRERIPEVTEYVIGIQPSDKELEQVLQAAKHYDQFVIGTYNAAFSEGQQRLVRQLWLEEGNRIPIVVVSLRNPFDYELFPEIACYMACYENKPLAMKSAAKVLTGLIKANGRLPVTVGPYGWMG